MLTNKRLQCILEGDAVVSFETAIQVNLDWTHPPARAIEGSYFYGRIPIIKA